MMHISDLLGFTAAMSAASSTGLLVQLVDGPPRTVDEHAKELSINPRATGLVLDVLVAFGLAARDGDRVGASTELRELANTPTGSARTVTMWAHVPEFLRNGAPFLRMDAAREQAYSTVVQALGKMFGEAATELASKLDLRSKKILDIGCGSGVWSLAFAQRDPAVRVTGHDLPAVLESFTARATELGLADRIALLPGDVHQTTIPRAFDLVIVANVLRIESPDRARAIVSRAAAAVEPGGQLLIIDALAGGTPEKERARAVYGLHLGMRTDHGRVYSRAEINGWIAEHGLREQRAIDLDLGPGALGAIIASAGGASAGG
jgi:cyclopropane fatty-acyl-phospholipid synthase-like methyltransferase